MSSRYKLDKETAASNGPVERHYRGVCKHGRGYGARVTNPGKRTGIWLGTFDTPEEAALAYDSAARQLQGNRAKTNFPNPNHLLSPSAALPQEALELSLSSYSSGGQATTGPMFMNHPASPHAPKALALRDPVKPPYNGVLYKRAWGRYAAEIRDPDKKSNIWVGTFDTAEEATLAYESAVRQLQGNRAKTNFPNPNKLLSPAAAVPPEELELSLSSYSSGGQAATGTMSMYHPLAPLPTTEALELRLSSYSSVGPMFMYHPGEINNDIHNNVNMSCETSVGGSSKSGYSLCS